jgi:hypothetical protein
MQVDDTQENAVRCFCPDCPTYDDCMREGDQRIFCARGTSSCGPSPKSCICGRCPVWAGYGLASYYFCIQGAAQ